MLARPSTVMLHNKHTCTLAFDLRYNTLPYLFCHSHVIMPGLQNFAPSRKSQDFNNVVHTMASRSNHTPLTTPRIFNYIFERSMQVLKFDTVNHEEYKHAMDIELSQ
jgi:hypothetical protein